MSSTPLSLTLSDDLLHGVCRRNSLRVSVEEYRRRVEAKQVTMRWPRILVVT